jgi:hypothetical protein
VLQVLNAEARIFLYENFLTPGAERRIEVCGSSIMQQQSACGAQSTSAWPHAKQLHDYLIDLHNTNQWLNSLLIPPADILHQ